jgi:uncharacterized protein YdhG (YjbR/CyaY superfamily)
MTKPTDVAAYIASFPADVQPILQAVRRTIQKAAPKTEETISYGIPTYKLDGKAVIHYSGAKKHVGMYPFSQTMADALAESSKYDQSGKGTIRFPLDKPMPHALIAKIVKFRLQERESELATKKPAAKKGAVQDTQKKSASAKGASAHPDILAYNDSQQEADREICSLLAKEINNNLTGAESKIWHRHPVWFLDGNPIVGYSKMKDSVRLMFWSGQSFDESSLQSEGSFKAAEARYTGVDQVKIKELKRWLTKAKAIQWDYKNIVKRRGKLERLK